MPVEWCFMCNGYWWYWHSSSIHNFVLNSFDLYLRVTASVRNWNKGMTVDIPRANNGKSIKQINKLLRYGEDSRALLSKANQVNFLGQHGELKASIRKSSYIFASRKEWLFTVLLLGGYSWRIQGAPLKSRFFSKNLQRWTLVFSVRGRHLHSGNPGSTTDYHTVFVTRKSLTISCKHSRWPLQMTMEHWQQTS